MQIKINVEVKDGKNILRSFEGLPVPLFDTAKENLEKYGEEMLHLCFIGTSGKVNIQNKVRTYASQTDDAGEFVNSDKAVQAFAKDCLVTVGSGSELQSEKATLIARMSDSDKKAHDEAMAYAAKFNDQAKGNIAKRKDGEASAQ